MNKRTLTIIAAICVTVAVTNFLWLNDHRRDHALKYSEVCELIENEDREINAKLDSITADYCELKEELDSIKNVNIELNKELADHIKFVEKKTNTAIRDNIEQGEDIFRLHRWHWEMIDSTKTVE